MNQNGFTDKNKRCDLHCHSTFSDGTMSPTELIKLAEERGISALALTDHNTSKGLAEFTEAGRGSRVITVPGCEFSTEWNNIEIHIVGLFFHRECWSEIEDFLELAQIAKHNSNMSMIENLNKAGYKIDAQEAYALTDGEFNRAHVARVLMAKGYVASVDEAFKTLLKPGGGFYTPARRITAAAAIRFIKTYGAAAVMAHGLLSMSAEQMREFLPEAKNAGLDAIETRYSEYDEKDIATSVSFCEEFGLLQSGGSDFHGGTKPDIALGTGKGSLFVPYEFYENLRSRADYDD